MAEVRRLEAIAEIKRLDVEKERLAVDRLRLMAETKFTEGPRTFREKQSGNEARSQAVKNYGSIFAGVFQAGIILFALYVVMQFI